MRLAGLACRPVVVVAAAVVVVVVTGCAARVDERALPQDGEAALVGAGDIGDCTGGADATAALVEQVLAASSQATAFTAGDNAYDDGALSDFVRCYDPSWGRFEARTIPTAGNHDWRTPDAAGFRATFHLEGAPTWSSTDVGAWHVIILDSDCAEVGGCGEGSPQATFLAEDLLAHPGGCTMAVWHHPRFSSGTTHGSSKRAAHLWALLDAAGAELVVSGHEHDYERFAPLHADGSAADDGGGLVSFVAGTGGGRHYELGDPLPGSQARVAGVSGVLVLLLEDGAWRSRFVAADGAVLDEADGACR